MTCMPKMHAILMAQRMPSRHSDATSWSSQSCRPTLKAASRGVQASWNAEGKRMGITVSSMPLAAGCQSDFDAGSRRRHWTAKGICLAGMQLAPLAGAFYRVTGNEWCSLP